jgi:hypothetical protein
MARLQFSSAVRQARIIQFEATIGPSPTLEIRAGTIPTHCTNPDDGQLLCSIVLPSNWMASSGGGAAIKTGTWIGTGLPAAGSGVDATYFRIKTGATCHCQGDISEAGGGGAMILDDISVSAGETVNVNTFSLADGNA